MTWEFKQWYADHRDEFNARRKERYKTDEEYRKKIRKWNAAAHSAKRKRMMKEQRDRRMAARLKLRSPSPVKIQAEQGELLVFPIGFVAKAVGRGVQSLRRYERVGIIPKTPYRSKNGTRLYTEQQVVQIRSILEAQGRTGDVPIRQRGFRRPVKAQIRTSNGKVEELYLLRIGYMASALERTVQYVTQLETKGLFPRTPLRLKGHRLYSTDMIEIACDVMKHLNGMLRGGNLKKFGEMVSAGWEELGLLRAEIVTVLGRNEVKDVRS